VREGRTGKGRKKEKKKRKKGNKPAMEQLSQELIDHIATYVAPYDESQRSPFAPLEKLPSTLPLLATISRSWQAAIERRTFADISINSEELYQFASICTGTRRRCLRTLTYKPVLPTYDDAACGRFERDWERRANDEAFTTAIKGLLNIVKAWEDDGHVATFSLVLADLYSPMEQSEVRDLATRRLEAALGKRHDIFGARFQHSRVRLLAPETLPEVRSIHSFTRGAPTNRFLDLPTCVSIASRLPNAKSLDWGLYDGDRVYNTRRRASRDAFAEALSTMNIPQLRDLNLQFFHETPLNQRFRLVDLVAPAPVDPLSSSLCLFSRNLTSFRVAGVIDESLLTPRHFFGGPFWPALQHLSIEFDKVTPSGRWYFREPRDVPSRDDESPISTDPSLTSDTPLNGPLSYTGEGPDFVNEEEERIMLGYWPYDVFRTRPDDNILRPLLMAFATSAAYQMPRLLSAEISTWVNSVRGDYPWRISWLAPGQPSPHDSGVKLAMENRRLYFETKRWRPEYELHGILLDIGRERFGPKCDEEYVSYQNPLSAIIGLADTNGETE
jgi:hypothetical protein